MARQGYARIAFACVALAAAALPASADAASYAKRTLKVGSKGTDVKQLQKYLNTVGIDTPIDGSYGRGTASAVKKFERADHDRVDGQATAADQKAIRSAAQNGETLDDVAQGTGGASYNPASGNSTAKATISPDGRTAIAP